RPDRHSSSAPEGCRRQRAAYASQAIARPDGAVLDRRQELLGEIRRAPVGETGSLLRPAKPATRRRHQRGNDIIAEAPAQRRAQISAAVGDTELDGFTSDPEIAGEQVIFRALQAAAATFLDQCDELLMHTPLHGLQPLDIVRVLGKEWIKHGLAVA